MTAVIADLVRRFGLGPWQHRYGFAFVTVGLAWLLREQFLPEAAERSPFVVFGVAILLTSIAGGLWPGLLATALSGVIALFFYLPPYVALSVHAPFDAILLTIFVAEGLVAATAGELLRVTALRHDSITESTKRFARFVERAEAVRGRPLATVDPLLERLTARELEVARLLALGLANDEIAEALFVSRNTVKTHLKRIYDKLSVRTRTEAVAKCVELGLLAVNARDDGNRAPGVLIAPPFESNRSWGTGTGNTPNG
jgi:DNA-binding CsgD family transcriptional regulator